VAVPVLPGASEIVCGCGSASFTVWALWSWSRIRSSMTTPDGTETTGGVSVPPAAIVRVVSTCGLSDTPPEPEDPPPRFRVLPLGTSGGRLVLDVVVTAAPPLVAVPGGAAWLVAAVDVPVAVEVAGEEPVGPAELELDDEPPHAARATANARHAADAVSDGPSLIAPSIDTLGHAIMVAMTVALLTTYLSDYRLPLYRLLAQRHDLEVLCYGGGERYVPPWFTDLDAQLAAADFPARRLDGIGEALRLGRTYEAVIAPFAGGALLPAAYAGARLGRKPFVFWASIWHQPRSVTHALALPVTRHIFRHSDAVIAYGEHVRRFIAGVRGHDDDIFVAPQSVEPALFRRDVGADEVTAFRAEHTLSDGPLVLYAGRLVAEKGVEVLARAWPQVRADATLVVVGDGPLRAEMENLPHARVLGPLPRPRLPVAYATAEFALLPSIPTPRFKEPWGLVCNEAMEQGRPMIATTAVGAVAGGLVRNEDTGLTIPPNDPPALAGAINRLLTDAPLTARLGNAARAAVQPYTYEAMTDAFDRALTAAKAA
jgi:glycosyltransferase involved in cell wall biosynthesis